MGQIHHQFVFPLFGQGGFPFSLRQSPLYGVQLPFKRQHFRRKLNLRFIVCQQGRDPLIDLAEIAGNPPKNSHHQYCKYQKNSRGEEDFFVSPKVVAVIIKRFFVFYFEHGFQQPHHPIANPLFPNEKIQPCHHRDGGNDIDTHASDEFELKGKVFVFWTSFQFCILLPILF